MTDPSIRRNTILFVSLLMLGGLIHMLDWYAYGWFSSLLFTLVHFLYSGLVLFWIGSIRRRLLPSRVRSYLVAMGVLMCVIIVERSFRFRLAAPSLLASRYSWYAYYVPIPLLLTLFWMACLRLGRGEERGCATERLLLIPALLLACGVLTNDLHHLAFVPLPGYEDMDGLNGTYTHGPLFVLTYVWMGLCLAGGLIELLRASRRMHKGKWALAALLCVPLWAGLHSIQQVLRAVNIPAPFIFPELTVFCMMCVCEMCIRGRLIPYNENYGGFFRAMRLPAAVTDLDCVPACVSAVPIGADRAQLAAATEEPLVLREGLRLIGQPIRAGYAFWTVDETELVRQDRALQEGNRRLERDNELIAAEAAVREQRQRMELRSGLYRQVAQELRPAQEYMQRLLDRAGPDAPDLRGQICEIVVLGACIKRKTDLLLKSLEHETLDSRSLLLALEEVCRYLELGGAEAAAGDTLEAELPSATVVALFDSFAFLLKSLQAGMRRLVVTVTEQGLRLCTDAQQPDALPETPLPVTLQEAEGLLYLTVLAAEGGRA